MSNFISKRDFSLKRREIAELPPEKLQEVLSRIYPEEIVKDLMKKLSEDCHTEQLELSDDDVVIALKCCCSENYEEVCPKCPLHRSGNCNSILAMLSLDLINRYKAEIDRLKEIEYMYNDLCR